jgi:hypothetical protein
MTDPLSISLLLIPVTLAVIFLLWVLWRVELDIRRTRAESNTCPAPTPPMPVLHRETPLASWPSANAARTVTH